MLLKVSKLALDNQKSMEFITLGPLVVPLLCAGTAAQGFLIISFIDPCLDYYLVTPDLKNDNNSLFLLTSQHHLYLVYVRSYSAKGILTMFAMAISCPQGSSHIIAWISSLLFL